MENLEAAVGIYAGDARKRRRPRTEGEAAKYIEELTRELHPEGAVRPAPEVPTVMPPAVRRARPKPARSRKRQSSRRKTR